MSYVFISASKTDQAYARAFADRLIKEGFDVWLDDQGSDMDSRWELIAKAIADSAAFAIIMSLDAYGSRRLRREIGVVQKAQKPVFPLLLSGETWSEFESQLYVDVTDGRLPWPGFFEQLARHVPRSKGRGKDVTKLPVKNALTTGELISIGAQSLLSLIADPQIDAAERAEAGLKLARIGDPRPGVGLNANGLPDIAWVDIPSGEFLFGSTMGDLTANMNEVPQEKVTLRAYAISRYPITYAQYAAFVNDKGYVNARYWTQYGLNWRGGFRAPSTLWNDAKWHINNHPVVGVTWYEAAAFCRWLTEKLGYEVWLSSEMEWEKAARGTDGRRFPWGNQFFANHANCVQAVQTDQFKRQTETVGIGRTTAVGIYSEGASPYGVMDMSGNVWEWCASAWRDNYTEPDTTLYESDAPRVLRGGAWNERESHTRVAMRRSQPPDTAATNIGFRICAGPEG